MLHRHMLHVHIWIEENDIKIWRGFWKKELTFLHGFYELSLVLFRHEWIVPKRTNVKIKRKECEAVCSWTLLRTR